jgi:predicted lipoprotein with Yx(FWY)xxD motif
MKKTTRVAGMLVIAAALAAVGSTAAWSINASPASAKVTVSLHKTRLGPILVTSTGHTLYLFRKDRNGKSACSGTCATYWPPYVVHAKPSAGAGVRAGMLGTTRRSNGSLQVTYNRHPLYMFLQDKRAGQTTGEGVSAFGAKWYAVSAKGTAVIKAAAPPGTTTTTTSTTTPCAYPPCY